MILNIIIILGVIGLINLILFITKSKFKQYAAIFGRSFIGLVFIFSGFVKGVDPLGLTYRIEDYFIAYGTEWANPSALFLSILLCAAEFSMGLYLLLNLKTKINIWFVTGTMAFFTVVTLFDALNNPVPDCGCFGDAIKLTNWETFYKNIVIILFLIPVIIYRNKFKSPLKCLYEWLTILIIFTSFTGFILFNYNHLPIIDFSPWKVNTEIYSKNPKPVKYYFTYQNKETKETKEYLSPNYPFNDSIWMSKWEFVKSRIEDPNKNITLFLEDEKGNNCADQILKNKNYQFIITIHNLKEANANGIKKIKKLCENALKNNISIAILSTGNHEEFNKFKKDNFIPDQIKFFSTDDIELKIMIRSNPGIMLIKDGIIINKWHYSDTPELSELKL